MAGWEIWKIPTVSPCVGEGAGSAIGNPINLHYHMQHTVQQLFHSGPTFQDLVRTARSPVGFLEDQT